jgi:formylglycine-generating enzyme required for sulfatase activity
VAELVECVGRADALRQAKVGAERPTEDGVLYGLLLALGEFELAEVRDATPTRSASQASTMTFLEQLADWYANDPSSAIHGAAGWLLRRWKQDETAKKVDETAVPYVEGREWFTLEFVPPDQEVGPDQESGDGVPAERVAPHSQEMNFFITFVVFPAGESPIGSPPDEADHLADENLHPVKLTRSIAMSDREITWAQLNPFLPGRHDNWERQFRRTLTPQEPAFGISWYEAVGYCRWLSQCAQMSEADQAYPETSSLDPQQFPPDSDPQADGAPRNWPLNLDKRGFRIPTEAEWEVACRGGTSSARSFGNDSQILAYYGWFIGNRVGSSTRGRSAGGLRRLGRTSPRSATNWLKVTSSRCVAEVVGG